MIRKLLPHRRVILTVGGLGFLCAAGWVVAVTLGLAAVGLSLLLIDYLTGE